MYPLLAESLLLRQLEVPILYDILTEDIWELDEEALEVLQYFTGSWSVEEIAKGVKASEGEIEGLIETLGGELILDRHILGDQTKIKIIPSPIPSLRTLLIHTTLACNLACRHCYLDKSVKSFIDPSLLKTAVQQLDAIQGYKVLISGGEPLLHPQFFDLLESIGPVKLRRILLSNGVLINESVARRLKGLIQEVQISIDGTNSHNEFRANPRAFEKAINAIKTLRKEDIDVSVATMIHAKNIEELSEIEKILRDLEVKAWALDVPSRAGEFKNSPELYPTIEEAGNALKNYGWGAPFEETSSTYACGSHLCALMPNGDVSKCGFFTDSPVGNLNQMSLADCWNLIRVNFIWRQQDLECANLNCPYLADCKGGCRFRASVDTGSILGRDRVKCEAFNFKILNNKEVK